MPNLDPRGGERFMAGLPTGTVTFLFTDIQGSTQLLQHLGDRRYADVLEEHRRLLRAAIQEHGGQEVHSQGDAFFAVFLSAQEAMTAAVAAQQALQAHSWPNNATVQVRMGLHTGEGRLEAGYEGIDVHRAARICAAGHGGQILLSDATRGLVAAAPGEGVTLRDLGKHRLKDLPDVERLFQVVAAGLPAEFPAPKSLDGLPNGLPRQLLRLIGRPEAETTVASVRRRGQRPWFWVAALLVIAAAAVGIWRVGLARATKTTPPITGTAPRLSIVVLPFTALGKETDQSFADAIVQDATMEMSRMRGSLVIAWSTAASYRGKAMDPKQLGRDLGVRYVLEGSVQRAANHVEINAQLIDAETDSHLSVTRFDIELGDLLTVQNQIASRLRHTFGYQMVRNEVERAERNHTRLDAMDYVLRGDVLFDQEVSKDRYRHQQEMFERALQLDPRLPLAKLKLADALVDKVLDLCPPCDAPEADLRRADDLASQVLALHINDVNDADAHRIKGQILRAQAQVLGMQGRLAQAAAEYQAADALYPNNPIILRGLGRAKNRIGEPAEAIPALERSTRLTSSDVSIIGANYEELGIAHLMLGHIDEAIRWYEKALPYTYRGVAYLEMGAALALKGDRAAAQATLAEAARRNPEFTTIANIRRDYASFSPEPKCLALLEQSLIKGLRKAGVPEE